MEEMTMPKTENKTGRNFSSHANNNPVDYKKVRRDVFQLVEQLICSNTILTASLQHNELLQKKCLAQIQDMKAKIDHLNGENEAIKEDWNMCDEACDQKQFKINELQKIIEIHDSEKKDWLGAKEYREKKVDEECREKKVAIKKSRDSKKVVN